VSISQNDESPDGQIVYPRDSKAGGTWFAVSESGKTVCLLNGAFVRHHHNPPYKRSRGLMVLDFFNYDDPDRFFSEYNLEGMEPFTLIFARPGVLTELSGMSINAMSRISLLINPGSGAPLRCTHPKYRYSARRFFLTGCRKIREKHRAISHACT
ncbi:MAG: NRDE family protein, partial [Bacteroidota bacterium]